MMLPPFSGKNSGWRGLLWGALLIILVAGSLEARQIRNREANHPDYTEVVAKDDGTEEGEVGGFDFITPIELSVSGDEGAISFLLSTTALTAYLHSAESDAYTAGTLTFNSGTVLEVDGTVDFTNATQLGLSSGALNDLTDVTLSGAASGQLMIKSAGDWLNKALGGDATLDLNGTLLLSLTEAELEARLSDVSNVFTNNDGALDDDDLSDNSIANLGTKDHDLLDGLADNDHPQYVLDAGDTVTGALNMNDSTTDSPALMLTPQTGTAWNIYTEDAGDDLQIEANTASTEIVDINNIGSGTADLVVEGTIGASNFSGSSSGTNTGDDDNPDDNTELPNMAQNTIKMRVASGTGDPEDIDISAGLSLVTGVSGDFVIIEDATDGGLKRVNVSDFLTGGGSPLALEIDNVSQSTDANLFDVNSNDFSLNEAVADQFDWNLAAEVPHTDEAENISGTWEVQDDVETKYGNDADYGLQYDESAANQFLFTTTATGALATTDPMYQFLVGTTPTADQQVFGIAKGTQATNTDLLTIDEDGDLDILGGLTLGTALAVAEGGTGATTLNDLITLTTHTTGNYAAGDGEAGAALTGDTATAFFAAGTLEHERGGLEADVSAYGAGLYGQTAGNATVDVDTEAELETAAVGGANIILSTEIDTYSELNTIVADQALTHNGLIDTFSEIDAIVADRSLLNTADPFNISGIYEIQDDTDLRFGNDADYAIEYDEGVDNQLLFKTTATAALTTADPMYQFLVGTTPTADQQVFGVAKGTQATNTDLMTLDEDGDVVFNATATFGGTAQSTITEGLIVNDGSGGDADDFFTVETDNDTAAFQVNATKDIVIIDAALDMGTVETFTDSDATPDVSDGSYWNTNTTAFTITDFDGADIVDGQIIYVISKGAITYDVTTSGLKGGTADLVTASGDLTAWLYDGVDWILVAFTDQSDDLS